MKVLHDSADPDDPVLTSALLWLVCFPLAMSIEIVRSVRLGRRATTRTTLRAAGTPTTTQTS
jgi:hypothetical protein